MKIQIFPTFLHIFKKNIFGFAKKKILWKKFECLTFSYFISVEILRFGDYSNTSPGFKTETTDLKEEDLVWETKRSKGEAAKDAKRR